MLHLTVRIHGRLRNCSSLMKKIIRWRVAGCPPDAFSATGQLWGNPLYDWEYHKKTGYELVDQKNRITV